MCESRYELCLSHFFIDIVLISNFFPFLFIGSHIHLLNYHYVALTKLLTSLQLHFWKK